MRYAEAFKALGYELKQPRLNWTAEKDGGVAVSIWQAEICRNNGGGLEFDSRKHAGPLEVWRDKPGAKLRNKHLARALSDFAGYIDVVIVRGVRGERVYEADPWKPEERKGYIWKVTYFDPETGHYRAETFTDSAGSTPARPR